MLQSASKERLHLLASELPEGVGAFGRFLFLDAQLPVLWTRAIFVTLGWMPCVELVTHLWFRYPFPSEAPSSSQVQDTRFSSLEQGFESPWGHVQRHAAIDIAACVVLAGLDAFCPRGTGRSSN